VCQVTPAIHNTDDLHFIDRAFVSIGMRLKKDEIGPLDQHAGGRSNIGAAWPEPRMNGQAVNQMYSRSCSAAGDMTTRVTPHRLLCVAPF
jgi:hypothetical protein